VLDNATEFTGQIVGFTGTAPNAASSDSIELAGFNETSYSTQIVGDNVILTLDSAGGNVSLTFDDFGGSFSVSTDGTNTTIYDPPAATALSVTSGGSLTVDAASNATATFAGSTGTLVLEQPGNFTGHIDDFTGTAPNLAHSDAIDLAGINYNSGHFAETYNASSGLLTVTDGSHSASLTFDNFSGTLDFASDGNGGTLITDPPQTGATQDTSTDSTGNAPVKWGLHLGNDQIDHWSEQQTTGSALTTTSQTATWGNGNLGNANNAPPPHDGSVSIGGAGDDHFVFHSNLGSQPSSDVQQHVEMYEVANHPNTPSAGEVASLVNQEPHYDPTAQQHHDIVPPAGTDPNQWHQLLASVTHLH
jgi:hypothetical protein